MEKVQCKPSKNKTYLKLFPGYIAYMVYVPGS